MNWSTPKALIVATALVGLGGTGCTDVGVLPTSTITEANTFNDPGSYRAFLAKIYAGLAVSGQKGPAGDPDLKNLDEGFSQYLRLYWEHQELPTDEAIIGWGDLGLPELNTQLWATNNGFITTMYNRISFQVTMANQFLDQTTDAKLSSRNVSSALRADIKIFRAEARFLRALSYWHGLDLFGNIPIVTTPITAPPSPSTRQQLYDFLVSELTSIQTDLPAASGSGTYGRATKEAAQMLLATIYLNAEVYTGTGHYAEARVAAEQVINGPFTLDPTYQNIFLADNKNSPEIIFPVIQDGLTTRTWGGMTFVVHASCGGSMNNNTYGIDGCWWGLRLKPEAYNRYAAGDLRASSFYTTGQTVAIASVGDFTNGIAAPKFQNVTSTGAAGSNSTHVDTDFPMFRLAGAYLIWIEAYLRGGGGTEAQALIYFNALRERAYGNTSADLPIGVLTVGSAAALDTVLAERGRELLWEGHRRTDLVRYGLYTGGTYIWAWKGGVQGGAPTDSFRDLYPIPTSELAANPNMKQNPGYP
jgi:starch-binding outer membrane protein, SusD/RagB family